VTIHQVHQLLSLLSRTLFVYQSVNKSAKSREAALHRDDFYITSLTLNNPTYLYLGVIVQRLPCLECPALQSALLSARRLPAEENPFTPTSTVESTVVVTRTPSGAHFISLVRESLFLTMECSAPGLVFRSSSEVGFCLAVPLDLLLPREFDPYFEGLIGFIRRPKLGRHATTTA